MTRVFTSVRYLQGLSASRLLFGTKQLWQFFILTLACQGTCMFKLISSSSLLLVESLMSHVYLMSDTALHILVFIS